MFRIEHLNIFSGFSFHCFTGYTSGCHVKVINLNIVSGYSGNSLFLLSLTSA